MKHDVDFTSIVKSWHSFVSSRILKVAKSQIPEQSLTRPRVIYFRNTILKGMLQ